MRQFVVTLALAVVALAEARGQQKVDIRRAAAPNVSVRLSGAFTSLRIIAWPSDSIALTGAVGAGSRLEGGALNSTGPVQGMKFYIDGPMDASVSAGMKPCSAACVAAASVSSASTRLDPAASTSAARAWMAAERLSSMVTLRM